ncbi:major capsid protein [Solidesulfovibrio sp.]
MLNLRGLFTREAIIAYLTALPVLKTPVMDAIFTERPQHPFALLGADDIAVNAQPLPFIRRGGPSIAAVSAGGGIAMYEPLPVRVHKAVTAADMNNLQMLKGESLEAWARTKTDYLRRAVRRTTEALCARSLSGTLRWPVALENGGFDVFEVVYGTILSVAAEKAWNAADVKLKDVYVCLSDMEEIIQDGGYGGQVEIWAGRDAYNALFVIAENSKTTAQIRVEITSQGINVGGYLVKRRSEKLRDPESGAMTPAVPGDTVRMIALDAGHKLPYCAVDDLDANLQALPLFIKPLKTGDPSGYKLIAESKPFPVVNPKGVCDAVVL